ncbi:MAG: tetraacyldisaccharide 4'-kinase [Planctomycetota bacterium]|nr:tetraacyldisaccharide 4'-kinase [Planctomycetota bacterium]
MDEHAVRLMLEGGGGAAGRLLRAGLWFPGRVYGAAMRLRAAAYRRGWLPSERLPVPVVSVGNLTAGGSGKTPFTIMLVRELAARGWRPGVLLRGYRRDAEGISDEGVLYSRLVPGTVVRANPDRLAAARSAMAGGASILVLDDGFQHLRLRRDMDIVLVDATAPWGGGNCLPGGLLREPKAALSRARAVILTRSDQADRGKALELRREIGALAPAAAFFEARHRPARLYRLDGAKLAWESLRAREAAALSGIARPEAFRRTLADLGARVVLAFSRGDHRSFGREYLARALAEAERRGIPLIITEKDYGKKIFREIADNKAKGGKNIWVLGVDLEVEGLDGLLGQLELAVK